MVLREVCSSVERTFRPVAQSKNLSFTIDLLQALPVALQTDAQTARAGARRICFPTLASLPIAVGGVEDRAGHQAGWSPNHPTLSQAVRCGGL